jgi:hypothetical protein
MEIPPKVDARCRYDTLSQEIRAASKKAGPHSGPARPCTELALPWAPTGIINTSDRYDGDDGGYSDYYDDGDYGDDGNYGDGSANAADDGVGSAHGGSDGDDGEAAR